MERFERMVALQGGDLKRERPLGRKRTVDANRSGILQSMDGQLIGQSIIAMGGGRTHTREVVRETVVMAYSFCVGATPRWQSDAISHAECGSSDCPHSCIRRRTSSITASVPATAPAITSVWPFRYLVAL